MFYLIFGLILALICDSRLFLKRARGGLGSYDHLPRVQEMSLVSYFILVSYCIPVSYCTLASAYGLKAISDWFSFNISTSASLEFPQVP